MATTEQLSCQGSLRRSVVCLLGVIVAGAGIFLVIKLVGTALLLMGFVLASALALALWKPDLTTLAVVFAIWANAAATLAHSYHLPSAAAAMSFMLLGLPLFYYLVVRREDVRINSVLALMLVYLVVQIASAEFSRDVEGSFNSLAVFSLQGIVLYFMVLNVVRTPAMLRRCLWAMILAGVLLGALSFVQKITRTYAKDYAGFAVTRGFDEDDISDADAVQQQAEDQNYAALYPTWRAMGSLGDANYYGQIMLVLVPVALLRLWATRGWGGRTAALLALSAVLSGIVLSYSRGASIGLAMIILGLLCLKYLRLRHVLPVVLAGIITLAATDPMFIRRVETLGGQGSNPLAIDRSILLRKTAIVGAWHVFLDHPLLGVGIGQSTKYIPWYGRMYGYTQPLRDQASHNMYLQMLSETGLLGVAAFALVMWAALKPMITLRRYWARSHPEYAHTLSSLMLGVMGFLVTSTFLHLSLTRYLYLLLGLCGAATAIYAPQAEPSPESPETAESAHASQGAALYEV